MPEDKIRKFNPDVFGLFEGKVFRNLEGLFYAIALRE